MKRLGQRLLKGTNIELKASWKRVIARATTHALISLPLPLLLSFFFLSCLTRDWLLNDATREWRDVRAWNWNHMELNEHASPPWLLWVSNYNLSCPGENNIVARIEFSGGANWRKIANLSIFNISIIGDECHWASSCIAFLANLFSMRIDVSIVRSSINRCGRTRSILTGNRFTSVPWQFRRSFFLKEESDEVQRKRRRGLYKLHIFFLV